MHNNHTPSSLAPQGDTIDATNDYESNDDNGSYSLSIMTERNQALAATVYRPTEAVKAAVMIAPATGIKRQFYHNFASHLAA
ncbi:MAG: hypothetical protein ACI9JO_001618, partial [Psychrobacter okhotskensis]